MRAVPSSPKPLPEDFLRTFNSIVSFTKTMQKIKAGTVADANIELNRDECIALLWAMQLLAQGDLQRKPAINSPEGLREAPGV